MNEHSIHDLLRRHLPRHGEPPTGDIEASVERAWQRLPTEPGTWSLESAPRRRGFLAPTAAAAVIAAIVAAVMWPSGTDSALTLDDGSRIEVRPGSELSVEREADGRLIRLRSGSIIVNAAKQRDGPLYVRTNDMTVSVVGTVFVVNAANDGSRVAVIEGEVRVEGKAVEASLRPGQQVSTSPTLSARSLRDDVAWSPNASRIVQAFERGMAVTAGSLEPVVPEPDINPPTPFLKQPAPQAPPVFDEASIRVCDPDNLPQTPAGGRGGGANSFYMTPGRLNALCMTVAALVRTAYGYGPAREGLGVLERGMGPQFGNVYGLGSENNGLRVRGGPDWVRTERYTIEAVGGGTVDAETMRGPMLRGLLESRFRLTAHVETEPVQAFALTVASGGLKMTPVEASCGQAGGACTACERAPVGPGQATFGSPRTAAEVRAGAKPHCGIMISSAGLNEVIVGGGVGIRELRLALTSGRNSVPIVDQTGLTGRFNLVLEYTYQADGPGPTLPTAVEEQLGLRLAPTHAPFEFIVIDQIERPAPN